MARKFLKTTTALACLCVAFAGQAAALSLSEAVSVVVQTNPDVRVAVRDRRISDNQLRESRGQYYPQIDVRYQGGPEFSENDSVDFGSRTTSPRDNGIVRFRRNGQLTLTQLLFDGFQTDKEVERRKEEAITSAHQLQDQAQRSALETVQAYIDVLRFRDRIDVAKKNIVAHETTLVLVETRSDFGGGNIADVHQARSRLAVARSSLYQAEGDLREAEAAFLRVVGLAASDLVPVPNIEGQLSDTVEEAVEHGLSLNPQVMAARSGVAAAQAAIGEAEGRFYPDVRLQLTGTTAADTNGSREVTYNAAAQIVGSYSLYAGGSDLARVKQATEQKSRALEQVRVAERQIGEQIRVSWSRWLAQKNRLEALTDQAAAAEGTKQVYLEQFDIGQRSLLDVLDATAELFSANTNLVDATYLSVFAVYNVLASTGQLVQALGVSFPVEAAPVELGYNSEGQAEVVKKPQTTPAQ